MKRGYTQLVKTKKDDGQQVDLLFPHTDPSRLPTFLGPIALNILAYEVPDNLEYALQHPSLLGLFSAVKKEKNA